KALHSLRALGVGRAAAVVYNNLGSCLAHIEGAQAALEAFREGVTFAETRGLREAALAIRDSMLTVLFEVGEWDEVLRLGSEVVEEAKRQGSGHDEAFANADRAAVLAHRQGAGARAFCESVLKQARPLEDPPLVMWAMIGAAAAWARWGHVLEGAYALFGAGRCLAGLGRLKEARARFEAAAAAFARLGAEPALAEVRSAMGPDPLNPGPA